MHRSARSQWRTVATLLLVTTLAMAGFAWGRTNGAYVCPRLHLTEEQKNATAAFFELLKDSIPYLRRLWGNTVGDFCKYDGISKHEHFNGVAIMWDEGSSGPLPQFAGTLPELPNDLNGSAVAVNEFRLYNAPNLVGTLPETWASIPSLQYITLAYTGISGTLPESYSALTRLETLQMGHTRLTGTLPVSYHKIPNLSIVSVAQTSIGGTIPDSWSSLNALRIVRLDGTRIVGTIPHSWGNMNRLRQVNLSNTRITGSLPEEMCLRQPWLTISDFFAANTQLRGTLPNNWSHCLGLVNVDVSSTRISGCLPNWTQDTIKSLRMADTRMQGTLAASWAQLRNAKEFNLSKSLFCGCMPQSWSKNDALRRAASDANVLLLSKDCVTANPCTARKLRGNTVVEDGGDEMYENETGASSGNGGGGDGSSDGASLLLAIGALVALLAAI